MSHKGFFYTKKAKHKSADNLNEWGGMPEFVQEEKEPYKTLTVRFQTEEDYQEFAELVNQKLTPLTKSIWHPFKSHYNPNRKVYVDES